MIVFLFLSILFMLADHRLKFGLSSNEGLTIFIVPLCLMLSWIIVDENLRKDFVNRFLLSKKNLHLSICIPILVSIITEFVLNLLRFVPYWLGYDVINPGKNQVTTLNDFTATGLLFSVSVIGPFSEEFLFRYLPYGGLSLAFAGMSKEIKWLKNIYDALFINKNPKYIWAWIIITNIVFAMAHGPDILSFPLYFIPGIVFSLFFLRFGFLAAWISHGASNLFSGIAFEIIVNTIMK